MTHPALRPVLLALSIALLPAGAALAGNGLYLDIPAIPGESVDPGHVGQIDVGGLEWGVYADIKRQPGFKPEFRGPFVRGISWSQGLDKSAVPLFGSVTSGQPVASARFEVVKPDNPKQAPFLSLTAEPAMINSMSLDGRIGSDTGINASLDAAALTLRYDPVASGGTGPAFETHYDVANNVTTGPSGRQPEPGAATGAARAGLYLRMGSGGAAIASDDRVQGYEGWIAIDAFTMGTSSSGRPGDPGKTSVQELSWSQSLDVTAPAVLFNLLKGRSIGQVTIEKVALDRTGQPVTVMQQALNDVYFSSFSLYTYDPSNVGVTGSMNFSSFTQTLWPTLPTGGRGSPFSFGFDVVNGVAIPGDLAVNVDGFGNGNLDGSAAPIPEPQTWAMLLAGLAGLLGLARRRRTVA